MAQAVSRVRRSLCLLVIQLRMSAISNRDHAVRRLPSEWECVRISLRFVFASDLDRNLQPDLRGWRQPPRAMPAVIPDYGTSLLGPSECATTNAAECTRCFQPRSDLGDQSASLSLTRIPSSALPSSPGRAGCSRAPSGLTLSSCAPPASTKQPGAPGSQRRKSSESENTVYSERTRRYIVRKVKKGAWRRYGMIGANALLFSGWMLTYCESDLTLYSDTC